MKEPLGGPIKSTTVRCGFHDLLMLKEEYEEQYKERESAAESLCDGGDFAALPVFYGQILSGIILSLLDGAGEVGERHEVVLKRKNRF